MKQKLDNLSLEQIESYKILEDIKIERKNINTKEDKLLLNILLSQGWEIENSSIYFKKARCEGRWNRRDFNFK